MMNKSHLKKIFFNIFIILIIPITLLLTKRIKFNQGPVCKNCNVILITLDVMGSNHLPCYGYERNTAPNLCKFAKENVYFTRSYSNSSLTLPGTFSLFTSLYQRTHRIQFPLEKTVLNNKYQTLTQILRSSGYDTFFLGPMKNTNIPLSRGVDRGFNFFQDTDIPHKENELFDWNEHLKEFSENIKKGKRSFLYMQTFYLHYPYFVGKKARFLFTSDSLDIMPLTVEDFIQFTPELLTFILNSLEKRIASSYTKESRELNIDMYNKLKNATSLEEAKNIFYQLPGYEVYSYLTSFYQLKLKLPDNFPDERQADFLKALYDEKIVMLDKRLKPLFDLFKDKKIADSTIVVITSQHGEEFMENGRFQHGKSLYDSSISVPLIMSVPGIKNMNSDSLIQTIDIAPTILGLLGIEKPSYFEGKDLSGHVYQRPRVVDNQYLFSDLNRLDIGSSIQSIRDKRWKLHVISQKTLKNSNYMIF